MSESTSAGKWIVSQHEERFDLGEEFDTHEEALTYARNEFADACDLAEGEHYYVGQIDAITSDDLASEMFCADAALESADQYLFEQVGDEVANELPKLTTEQTLDLEQPRHDRRVARRAGHPRAVVPSRERDRLRVRAVLEHGGGREPALLRRGPDAPVRASRGARRRSRRRHRHQGVGVIRLPDRHALRHAELPVERAQRGVTYHYATEQAADQHLTEERRVLREGPA